MSTQELADLIADKAVRFLQKIGFFDEIKKKDPLTDVSGRISTADTQSPSSNGDHQVIGASGEIITLGAKNKNQGS
jgi:hypothetical protein